MNKTWLVFKREYIFRVKKKSFIIITILMPVLFAAFIILPAVLMQKAMEKHYSVAVIDKTNALEFPQNEEVSFVKLQADTIRNLHNIAEKQEFDAVLMIDKDFQTKGAVLYLFSDKDVTISEVVQKYFQQAVVNYRLQQLNITPSQLAQIQAPAILKTLKWTEKGAEVSSSGIKSAIGVIGGLLIYIFIFIYGGMSMRSVMEEKVNRVVELLISSVRPLQLMFGKLLAILSVAFTQFVIWIVLILLFVKFATVSLGVQSESMDKVMMVIDMIKSVNLGLWIFTFLFFFLSGYLLYASLFAAIGSAVDVETDAQQFVTPLTLPIIFAMVFIQAIIFNPDGQLAFWLSIIPFTSPIIMPLRISFGIGEAVMWWEFLLSIVLMILTVWASLWAAGKIFRMGILFYGKRPTYKDLWKWIKQG